MIIPFTKMQGLGNDFVVIDATQRPFTLSPDQIQKMAHRRTGVGFDQLLVLESIQDKQADFIYRIFNADGGEVGQCGNGARCMALFIRQQGISDRALIRLKTRDGLIRVRMLEDHRVEVDMGQPQFSPADIPFLTDCVSEQYHRIVCDQAIIFSVVNVGNPHAVIVVEDVDKVDVLALGKALAAHADFPEGVNVSFMQVVSDSKIRLRVFERGAGETQACGSAACAAAALGWKQGLLADTVMVLQPGGALEIRGQAPEYTIQMIGPAATVYRGEWGLEEFS